MNLARSLHTVAAALMAISLVHCTDGGPKNALDDLSEPERERIQQIVESSEEAVGFRLIFPAYLPSYLDPVPTVSVLGEHMPALIFRQQANDEAKDETPVISSVALYEEPRAGRSCPPCAASLDFHPIKLSGQAGVENVGGGEGRLVHEVHFQVADIFVYLTVDWEASSPDPTEDMREEAFRIAESIIESRD